MFIYLFIYLFIQRTPCKYGPVGTAPPPASGPCSQVGHRRTSRLPLDCQPVHAPNPTRLGHSSRCGSPFPHSMKRPGVRTPRLVGHHDL